MRFWGVGWSAPGERREASKDGSVFRVEEKKYKTEASGDASLRWVRCECAGVRHRIWCVLRGPPGSSAPTKGAVRVRRGAEIIPVRSARADGIRPYGPLSLASLDSSPKGGAGGPADHSSFLIPDS